MVETAIPYLASQCSSISTKRPRRNAQWWADKEDWIIFDVLDWVAAAAAAAALFLDLKGLLKRMNGSPRGALLGGGGGGGGGGGEEEGYSVRKGSWKKKG